jgi:hypothetical protein
MPNIPFASIYRFHVKDEMHPYWRSVELGKALYAKYSKDIEDKRRYNVRTFNLLTNLQYNLKFTRLSSERLPK